MSLPKPKLAIVSSHKTCCALAHYADAIQDFLSPAFNVEIIDLKTSALLKKEGAAYEKMSEDYIDKLCEKLQEFDLVNVHLELVLYGNCLESILSRLLKICHASGRLILTVHTISYTDGSAYLYRELMTALKNRPSSNPFHLIAHLPHEKELLKQHFDCDHVSDFPLIYLTNERRTHFQNNRHPSIWKKQFNLKETDITIGMFGLLAKHKNYLHALKTLNLLPEYYKLLIIGEAHHMNIKEWQVDPTVQDMLTYLDNHPTLSERVIFAGKRDDADYYNDLANIDFVLLPSFEVSQSGSATFSNALELSCAILKSNTSNCGEYASYFPNCFEVFDIGNYYETKNKILNFDRSKIDNLRKRTHLFSEVQFRKMYLDIYESLKVHAPIALPKLNSSWERAFKYRSSGPQSAKITSGPLPIRVLFNLIPGRARAGIRKMKQTLIHSSN